MKNEPMKNHALASQPPETHIESLDFFRFSTLQKMSSQFDIIVGMVWLVLHFCKK